MKFEARRDCFQAIKKEGSRRAVARAHEECMEYSVCGVHFTEVTQWAGGISHVHSVEPLVGGQDVVKHQPEEGSELRWKTRSDY